MDRFKKCLNNDKSKKKEYNYKDKSYKIFIVHFNNNIDLSYLFNLQSLFLVRSNNIDYVFILKDNLYIFTFKHCICSCNKVFCFVETKAKHKKNRIYIKTVKYKI